MEDFARAECLDTGKTIWECRMDIESYVDTLDYFARLAPTIAGMCSTEACHIYYDNTFIFTFSFIGRSPVFDEYGMGKMPGSRFTKNLKIIIHTWDIILLEKHHKYPCMPTNLGYNFI